MYSRRLHDKALFGLITVLRPLPAHPQKSTILENSQEPPPASGSSSHSTRSLASLALGPPNYKAAPLLQPEQTSSPRKIECSQTKTATSLPIPGPSRRFTPEVAGVTWPKRPSGACPRRANGLCPPPFSVTVLSIHGLDVRGRRGGR